MDIEYFKLAHSLNEGYKHILLKDKVHFRASLNSISLISISDEKPELGVKCNANNYKSTDNIDIILQDINKIKIKSNPKRVTSEKKLQSWIINYALNNNYQLPFGTNIKFITSELAIRNKSGKKIVTDILGYCVRENKLCVIELKSVRLLKLLIQQVSNFEEIILKNFDFFSKLLSVNDFSNNKPLSKEVKKIIVWPYKPTSAKKELKEADILEFTYQEHYIFKNYS